MDGDHHGSNALLNVSVQPVCEGGSSEGLPGSAASLCISSSSESNGVNILSS